MENQEKEKKEFSDLEAIGINDTEKVDKINSESYHEKIIYVLWILMVVNLFMGFCYGIKSLDTDEKIGIIIIISSIISSIFICALISIIDLLSQIARNTKKGEK